MDVICKLNATTMEAVWMWRFSIDLVTCFLCVTGTGSCSCDVFIFYHPPALTMASAVVYPTISCEDPLFQKADRWGGLPSDLPDTEAPAYIVNQFLHGAACWLFMRPLFSAHGYILYYSSDTLPWDTFPEPLPEAMQNPEYPYARRCYERDEDALFGVDSIRVWAARDAVGRDVVIRVVSDADEPSNELKVLQYLNEEGIRLDPRNRTIHVIEFLTFYNLIFAVMPRFIFSVDFTVRFDLIFGFFFSWDSAFRADFGTVAEVMQCGEQFLECLEFLQEHRIFHGDILGQNVGMNIVAHSNKYNATGRRDPSVTRYAVYDFGNSQLYPRDVSLRDFRATPHFNFSNYDLPFPTGPFNPFAVDFLGVALLLQRRVRHVENFVPALGPYFDRLILVDEDKRPSASEALLEFREILSQLSASQLSEKITTLTWEKGRCP
ncbi:hypothetical protein M413DRAFT_199466 [Hebeloma cylindrosporum]|uniref:Protein kinase domain-containing protein n=1 Tax=Hebeloma cylindrosporum TaxID=76867 RepID=A0A0C3CTI1_HEBCY|nr:hypothetical protein M413DRAFT_199466 [Hebeloma cylindrosporum h7]